MKVEELKSYVSPMVEVVAVAVEKGFAASPDTDKDPVITDPNEGDMNW